MALFQRQPQTDVAPIFTLGLQKTILIIGLGNPGKQYEATRHNIGFTCLDALADKQDFEPWIDKRDLKSHLTTKQLGNTRVILAKPTTFMNLSGEAAQAICHFYKIPQSDVVAVYDEYAIPFGQIRTRVGGEAAGHNGVKSLIQHLGADFGRLRIGINAESPMQMSDFVLAKFSPDEAEQMPALTREVNAMLSEYIYGAGLVHETRSFIV